MILCDVNNFKFLEPINKTEEKYFNKGKGGVDLNKLKEQHNNFVDALKTYGINVAIIKSNESCSEQVFVRDVAFKVGNDWCLCNMATKIRSPETEFFKKYLKENGVEKIHQFKHHIEGGDVLISGQTIFVGISARTDIEVIDELKKKFSHYKVVPITLKKDVLHLDCALGIVSDQYAIISRKSIDETSYKILSQKFHLIDVSAREQENMATNFLRINNTFFCEKHNRRVNNILKDLGFNVVYVDYNEFNKLGGSLRCCCLEFDDFEFTGKNYLHYENNQL